MTLRIRLRGIRVAVLLLGCAGVLGCQSLSMGTTVEDGLYQRGHAIFQEQTCVRTDTFEVVADDVPMDICLRIGLKSGTLNWQIRGPDGGHTRGSGDATEGKAYHVSCCIEVVPGEWQLVMDMSQASGEYEIAWYEPESSPSIATRLSGADH